jgi:hypothetical protein
VNKLQVILAGVVVPLAIAATADPPETAEPIQLRAGLWELSFKSDLTAEQARRLSAKIPESLLAEIPAAQRAEFKRMYESGELLRNALNTADTLCITEEDLEHGIQPLTDLSGSCSMSKAITHKRRQELHFSCHSAQETRPGAALVVIAANDPTSLSGAITRSVELADETFSIKADVRGTWLDSQCGDEAPEEDESPPR